MSTVRCPQCGSTAPAHFVACPSCHALFYAERLSALLREADSLESSGQVVAALDRLRAMVPLLPPNATQLVQLKARIAALEPKAAKQPGAPSNAPKWLAGLGTVGLVVWKLLTPLLLLLSKGKLLLVGLLKVPTLISFLASAALWRDGTSGFAVAFVILGSIYVHEMGHTWAFRRYGIEVTPPMFVPGFGAFVRGTHYPSSAQAIGDVALSGPVWGGVSGLIVFVLGLVLGQPWLVASSGVIAEINLFNLFPVWQLDGSRATAVLSKSQVVMLSFLALGLGAVAQSPMALLAGVGLLARRFIRAPQGDGDRRTAWLFAGLLVSLLALRIISRVVAA